MTSAVFVPLFIFTLNSGGTITAVQDDFLYKDEESCMMQAEADAKNIAADWERINQRTFKNVNVRCVEHKNVNDK